MKILVCGSRDWTDVEMIREELAGWKSDAGLRDDSLTIIHGAARGADLIADREAKRLGLLVEPYPADWQVVEGITEPNHVRSRPDGTAYDAGAGRRRNLLMFAQGPDLVLAFQRNGSSGTGHTIHEARKRGVPVVVFTDRTTAQLPLGEPSDD